MDIKKYSLSIILEDKPGALTRVTGLFARRNFNIHSLVVGPTKDFGISHAIILTDEYAASIDQIVGQLKKLVYVLDVKILDQNVSKSHETALESLLNNAICH